MWSVSFSFRLGLGFHALNNEGSDGSNLMQPRRIDVGKISYDGISGEIVRRHILEKFVRICEEDRIPLLTASKALHPDRGPLGLREIAKKQLNKSELTKSDVYLAARKAVQECALVDAGGYLAAFSEKGRGEGIPESGFIGEIAAIAKGDNRPYTVKRDSVFDVGWLISEAPQDMTITQHAAYRPTGDQSLFSQTMRSNVYGGIMRADLYRIGTDDYWYLHQTNGGEPESRVVLGADQLRKRQKALVRSMIDYLASPAGAKTAGWAPHVFKTQGVILLSSKRTAPFASPISVNVADGQQAIRPDPTYQERLVALANEKDTWVWTFQDIKTLLDAGESLLKQLDAGDATTEEDSHKSDQ